MRGQSERPWLMFQMPVIRKCNKRLIDYVAERLKEHEETFDPDNIRDFMDLHIQMKRSGEHKETLTGRPITRLLLWLLDEHYICHPAKRPTL